ncbi:uncharacterized protein [Hetaerina americana]|uniref:uncharacterized protein isoform X2 n=1 Tax=Hetaerina americana TaxID=62018 RepID=UPI003A7F1548
MHNPPSSAAIPSSSRLLVGRRPPLPLLRRSSSLRSRRSVTSTGSSSSATVATTASGSKRVSFHRDVRVKRIPSYLGERGRFGSGSFKRRHRPAPSPPPDPSAGLVRRLDPPHSRQALAKEARKVLREADRVTCTTLPLPKGGGGGGGAAGGGGGGKAAIPLLLLNRRKHRRAQPPPRLLISPPLPPQSSVDGAPLPAVVTFSSEEGGGASTTDYSSLERPPRERRKKKALSPIIEATTPVIAGPASGGGGDYFSARSNGGESRSIPKDSAAREDGGASGDSLLRSSDRAESSLDSLTKEDYGGEVGEETSTRGVVTLTADKMVHSSQMPADRPPLTRGTVTGLAQQLSITRRPKGPPPVVGRGYATTLMDAYGTDDYIVNHNNNRPFSYTDPSNVQTSLAKSAAHPRNGVDSDGIGGLDQRIPRGGKEVIYAQVVVSGRDGGGGGEGGGPSSRTGGGGVKRTVHTSVLNHQRVEKVPVVVAAEGAGRIYTRPKGRKRLGSEGEEEEEEEEYEEEKTKAAGEEEEEDEGIAGDMMRIGGGGGVGAGGVTSTSYYTHHHRSTSSRAADSGKVDYDGDYRTRRHGKLIQKASDPRRIENYKRFDEDDEDDAVDRTYRRGSLDYGLNKAEFNKGLGYNRKDLFDSGIENDSGVGGSGRRRPKTGGKMTVGEGVTAKIVMNGGPNLRSAQIGGSCNNISRVTITNDNPGISGSKDRFFYYGASPEDSMALQDKRRGSGSTTTTVTNNKGGNVSSSSMASTRLVRAADKRRDADLPTSSVLIRHWAPSSDDKHSGHDQQLIVEESKVQESYYHRERRRRRRRTSEGYEEEEEEEVEERNGHPQDGDESHFRRPRSGKEKGKGRLEDLEEEEQRVNGKGGGSHSDIDECDDRNNNTTVTSSSRRYQKKGEATLKKKDTSALIEEEDQYAVDKKGKGKKGEKEGEEKKKRGFRNLFSRKSGVKETTEEKGGVTSDYNKSTYDRRKDRTDGYASAEERRIHANSTNPDPSGRHKDRWFSEDEIDRRTDRTPPSRRKYEGADVHSSSATLSRLVANNNRKNKAAAANSTASDANGGGRWFKSLDRLTRRKKKEEEEEAGAVQQKEGTPPPKADGAAPGGNKKNLRFFGDTDQESVTSGNQRALRNGTRRPVGIMASGRRSGASEEEESGTTTESSAPSQRSVYLHAATVGDIPGPAKAPAPAAQQPAAAAAAALSKTTKKKAGSREELHQRRPMVANKTTLSRSVSVLAPWRPRHRPGSNVDVHYDSSGAYTPNPNGNGGGMVTGRPPKAPRTANGTGQVVRSSRGMSASVESLQRAKKASPPRHTTTQRSRDGRESALRSERRHGSSRRDVHKVGVERVTAHDAPTRGSSGVTVTRSASMPKDSRLAGWWFRRKKVGQATGKENYGGSANRG